MNLYDVEALFGGKRYRVVGQTCALDPGFRHIAEGPFRPFYSKSFSVLSRECCLDFLIGFYSLGHCCFEGKPFVACFETETFMPGGANAFPYGMDADCHNLFSFLRQSFDLRLMVPMTYARTVTEARAVTLTCQVKCDRKFNFYTPLVRYRTIRRMILPSFDAGATVGVRRAAVLPGAA